MAIPKKSKYSRPRTEVRAALRSVEIPNPCIIMVKSGTTLASKAMIQEMVNTLNRNRVGGMVVVVDDFNDLSVIGKEDMRKMGWEYVQETAYVSDTDAD